MMTSQTFLLAWTIFLSLSSSCATALAPYRGTLPQLRHAPFGFAQQATGGSTNTSAVYVVRNAPELRAALALPFTKTIYVQGVIQGNELVNGSLASCQTYIDSTGTDGAAIRQFNHTLYIYSLNATYVGLIKDAEIQNVLFEGKNATEYRTLLAHMNGWRAVVSQTQKAQVGFHILSNTSLVGWDANAALNGINLYISSVNNIWLRNLKLVSPSDCFPAPETFPSSWNALYDAVGLVTSTNVWVDGCELQDQLSGEYVEPDIIEPGWQVDRFDGLFDCEDGTDNVTFSHNIIRNHHKSMLLGGGTKEADRDLNKMHFTIFGNYFYNSASRNPLMRFGTFDISANLFESVNNQQPLFNSSGASSRVERATIPQDAVFEYHFGVYNQSKVLVRENVFVQSGSVPEDTSRLFTFREDTLPALPAKVCIPEAEGLATLNGTPINVTSIVQDTVNYLTESTTQIVQGAVLLTCDWSDAAVQYSLPASFRDGEAVKTYVLAEAGQDN